MSVNVETKIGRHTHGEDSGLGMLEGKVLIGEFLSVDRFASRSISASKVTALNHEIRDDAVELAILKVKEKDT